ncbi:MAG TPA: MgtC/SapB family protein, partial [Sphingomicrobium sp.]|nr:MgtC/SapB family protein [Sphingomicrobium sp.]
MIESLDLWAQHGLRVGVGLAVGILVGLERGFKLKDQPDGRRVAGVRTFSLLGLGGGIAGLLGSMGQMLVSAVLMLGAIGMLAIAYAPKLKAKGDATSPVAAIATLGI